MTPHRCKVLIVEDDESVRAVLKLQLTKKDKDIEIVEARNGMEGLGLARQLKPRIVITDLMMPVMGGIDLVQELRADFDTKEIFVIVITSGGDDLQKQAHEAGADAVLSKPFARKDLVALIDSVLVAC